MSAVVRRLRPVSSARLALHYVRGIMSNKPLVVSIALLCTASVLYSVSTQNDITADDPGQHDSISSSSSSGTGVDAGTLPADDRVPPPQRLFVERPLIVLTLSYHAAPIYDLMDQLQPLGVKFIERGINAYACRYFNTCRQDGLLEACHIDSI